MSQINLILLGPPGSGKGTQAQMLEKKLKLKQIAMGDLLRAEKSKKTELAKELASYMDKGLLVPFELTTPILQNALKKDYEKGFVLDGYPRQLEQAEVLNKVLMRLNKRIDLVILIDTSEKEVLKRLSSRWQCKSCNTVYGRDTPPKIKWVCDRCKTKLYQREDDKPKTIRRRLKVYREQTEPVIEYYERKGLLRKVNGDLPVEKIFEEIGKILKEEKK